MGLLRRLLLGLTLGSLALGGIACRRGSDLTGPNGDTTAFEVRCDPASLSVPRNGQGTTTCTVTSSGTFSGDVQMACADLPTGVACDPDPATVSVPAGGSATSALRVRVGRVSPGRYAFRVVATFFRSGPAGSVEQRRSFPIGLTVPPPDFSVDCSPTSLSVPRGSPGSVHCTVASISGFDEPVDLTCVGLSTGIACEFSPAVVTPPPGGSALTTLTVRVAPNANPGLYTFQVRGTGGGQTHAVDIRLTVPTTEADFSITCTPSTLTVPQDQSRTSTCVVTSLGGFADRVRLSCVGLPPRVDCQFDPNTVEPTPDRPAPSTLTVRAAKDAPTGTYDVQVEGVGGGRTRSFSLRVTVVAGGGDFGSSGRGPWP